MDHPCVTENIEGETGKNRVGKQRRSMDVAEKAPPHMTGNSVYPSLSPREKLPTEDPSKTQSDTCLHHVLCHTQLRYVLSLSETSICRGKTDSIDHSVRGRQNAVLPGKYQSVISCCISKKKN